MSRKINYKQLTAEIKTYAKQLGFADLGVSNIDLSKYEPRLLEWLAKQFHGEMDYMQRHGSKRSRPEELLPGTIRIINVRMNYLPPNPRFAENLAHTDQAYISRYALGRDYHKLIRKKLEQLAKHINKTVGNFNYRAFADSAPVLEKPLAEKSNLGWIGKNTLLINKKAGSWFFLGALYTDIPLLIDQEQEAEPTNHCGRCHACIDICPTQAIVAPYKLDARRCISYLTIEYKGIIPEELRPLIGNRIFGCDDCQIVCPWNRFAKTTEIKDFHPRHSLDQTTLIELFNWTEAEFLEKTAGSAIRRTGYEAWLRNIAIALGNAPYSKKIMTALTTKLKYPSGLVRKHVEWALQQQKNLQKIKL